MPRVIVAQAPIPTPEEIEAEVLANVKGQPLGEGTVADLALPDDFLRRVADRVVRASFEERYRIVVEAEAPRAPGLAARPSVVVFLSGAGLLAAALIWVLLARRRGSGAA